MAKSVKPAPGYLVVEDLDPKDETQLASGSSLELSGTNPHDQLKVGRVLFVGDAPFEVQKVYADIAKFAAENGQVVTKAEAAKIKEWFMPPAAVGDTIAYQSLSAHALRLAGKQYRLVEYEHVIATIGEDK